MQNKHPQLLKHVVECDNSHVYNNNLFPIPSTYQRQQSTFGSYILECIFRSENQITHKTTKNKNTP